MQEPALTVGIQEPLPKLPDLSIAQLLSIRHDEAFSNARRRKKGPKSAVSAFAYFNAAKLEGVVNECSDDMEPHRIVAIVAERWEALSDQDRAIYDELAAKDQLRYEMQCRPSNAKALELAAKKSKKRKHPGAPKHPKSAYLFFVGENRDTIKGEATPEERNSFTAIAKILGEKWKHLPEEQKDMYQKMADDDKERYRQEKIAFLQRRATITLEEEEEQAQSVGSDHPVEIEEEQNGETCTTGKRKRKHPLAPKHPLSAYLFFVATHRAALTAKYTDKTFTEVAKIIGDIWQQMTPAQRRKYEILASADKKRYEFEMRAWSKSSSNPQNDADQRNQTGNGTHSTSENGVIILGKRQRDHEAAQTISSMAAIGGPTTDKTKKHAISNVSDEPQPVLESYGHNSLESSQYESPAYRAFVKSESEYILSVDPDIDPAELDAALRLTWMEMSAHEKLAFVLGDEQASEQAAPESDRAPLPKDISEWTSEHVAQYVADDLGFSQYYQAFLQSSFTGSVLPTITTAILKKELGITILSDRKAIKTAFDALLA